jgi:lactate dehydrogenase-like 2-hydroxyacid dehydrogenase
VTRPRVLVARRVLPRVRDELDALFDVDRHDADEALPAADLRARAAGTDGILTVLSDRVDAGLLDAAGPQLRVVANHAVGYENVDVEAATARGVLVANTPDVLTFATAELALTILLGLARRVVEGDRFVRARTPWRFSLEFMLGSSLEGRTLGVVGLGRIGSEVARLAEAFRMNVVYSARSQKDAPWPRVGLDELLARADVVILTCPLTEETRHLIDADALRAMRRDALLVNVSRGPVVDEAALVEALRTGEIAGAALDVYEREPEVHERLLELENVVLSPHLGSATRETREAMGMLCVEALRAVLLEGRVPRNALNPDAATASERHGR